MQYVLFACGISMLLFSSVQLLTPNKKPVHYFMVSGCVPVAYILFHFWAHRVGLLVYVPVLALSDIAVTVLAIPGFYFAALTLVNSGTSPTRSFRVYFSIFLLVAIAVGVYNALTVLRFVEATGRLPSRFELPVVRTVSLLVYSTFVVAILHPLTVAIHRIRTEPALHRPEVHRQLHFLSLYLVATFILVIATVYENEPLLVLALTIIGLIATAFSLTALIASYFSETGLVPSAHPCVRRPDWDCTEEGLAKRLDDLMNRQEAYREPELTLPQLAKLLNEKPLRLSYHLKMCRGTNFRGYINDLRLQAVARDLVNYPDKTILEIAFSHGFNSKSSFNTLFFAAFGKTPRDFRKDSILGSPKVTHE